MSAPVRPTQLVLAAIGLALGLSACGADHPPGTISQDDLPGDVEVAKVVKGDDQAGQVVCTEVNNAEDNQVMTPSDNYDRDRRAAVTYELEGSSRQTVSNSVWRLSSPKKAVDDVAAGLATCVKDQPDAYQRFEVQGYPDALGYTETGGEPATSHTRRILVPLPDRVVIVTATREGGSDFAVSPEDLVKPAIDASADAPER